MSFEPGQPVIRRYLRGDYVTWAQATHVVSDDESGLLLWNPMGAGFACRENAGGERLREVPLEVYGASSLVLDKWRQTSCLILVRPGSAHSVWWVFRDDRFDGWYVNLEEPARRWSAGDVSGIDTIDHGLDVVVSADRQWEWKDEPDFREYVGAPGYWSAEQAGRIRAEGERVIGALMAGVFPFDGRWCDFRPDPSWIPQPLPAAGWQDAGPEGYQLLGP
ncbi:MAG TPA: DUF402 domain-containing protein [Mycobacteriales bacterium]|nr:DUF402 domain-containing protein [Mycobacteriales bacterium]